MSSQAGALHILFIRHGETQDNIDRILQGHRDTSLTPKGHQEAEVLAKKLKSQSIEAIYHSPLIRILQTIDPVLRTHPDVALYPENDLKGQCLGELEGGSYDTVDMDNPRSADGKPDVENFDDFVARLMRVMGKIVGVEAHRTESGTRRNVAVATHGVGITSIIKALEERKIARRGPEVYEVRWPDSDDVARLTVERPLELPVKNGELIWEEVKGRPFLIERWGKKEKALQ